MEGPDSLDGLRGLFQDLSALSNSSIPNIERLRVELESHIDGFRKLIDKPAKNNSSRQAILSGVYGPYTSRFCGMVLLSLTSIC